MCVCVGVVLFGIVACMCVSCVVMLRISCVRLCGGVFAWYVVVCEFLR